MIVRHNLWFLDDKLYFNRRHGEAVVITARSFLVQIHILRVLWLPPTDQRHADWG